ncbi:metallophosphoesterase [Candidatus Woesearchaeota archaeon]|nr:metallophosphoesterase [Candidatus Woesearchaeota archaeon]
MPEITEAGFYLSRRSFLISAGILLGELALEASPNPLILAAKQEKKYSDAYLRDGGLVVLPSHGTLYVASDFHGRVDDYTQWLRKTSLVERIRDDEDAYGVILGDVVDVKQGDPYAPHDGDQRILESIMKIQEDLGPEGKRFMLLQGNHEAVDVMLYELLKKGRISQAMIDDAYNFAKRMSKEHYTFLKDLPIATLGKQGVVCVHGGPSKKMSSPRQIAKMDKDVVDELQWNRPHYAFSSGYINKKEMSLIGYRFEDVDEFLKKMEESTLLITGHTTTRVLPKEDAHNGIGFYGKHQVLLETSYGADKGKGKYLSLDLSRRYKDNTELSPGKEIQSLG